jgi:hypothetical protein
MVGETGENIVGERREKTKPEGEGGERTPREGSRATIARSARVTACSPHSPKPSPWRKAHTFGADSVGAHAHSVGAHADSVGAHADSVGAHADSVGAHADSVGAAHADSVGAHADSVGAHADSVGAHADSVGADTGMPA